MKTNSWIHLMWGVLLQLQPERDHLTLLLSLFPTADELHLKVDRIIGESIKLCLTNFPSTPTIPELDQARFIIRLTEVQESGGEPDGNSRVQNLMSRELDLGSEVCYEFSRADIRNDVPFKLAKIQVALSYNGVTGPYVPSLSEAEQIGKLHTKCFPSQIQTHTFKRIYLQLLHSNQFHALPCPNSRYRQ